jgi:RNA polymerase sigma factor (sigma-70 family)
MTVSSDLNEEMLRASKGDKESFRRLARALGPVMYRTALKLLGQGREADAEDAVQMALIKLWQSAPKWQRKKNGRVEGYAYRIVYTSCMDMHRKNKQAVMQDIDDMDLAAEETPHEILVHRDLHAVLVGAIDGLPDMQKQAVLLHYYSGYTQTEVADLIGKSEKATESLIIRARKNLAKSLPRDFEPIKEGAFYV